MKEFPHRYVVIAHSATTGDVRLAGERMPDLASASPAEFGGPGDRWSPETLLVAAVGDCFVLTFRAVAAASKLAWTSLSCSVTGTLDRVERVTQFTTFEVRAELEVTPGADAELARRVVDKAERNCLVSNSLKGSVHVVPTITIASEPVSALAPV
jgi:organic hydroperoxide reductase OsmC/OhrA